ncbi:hypothetical protein [Haliangium sp.]|uniref:hypothetical protein n=1 Tax=Haliangium sp. TaxID=2663208 RepID=UPI003D0BAF6F
MDSSTIAKFGILFLILGLAATFLMYWLWGFPFDKKTRTSAAPKPLMYTHRALGYLFLLVYIVIMIHMVPRMWEYQVEFPARTVAHIVLGITIGFLLVLKIAIMRFFRHFEEWMPYLGTTIMLCTVLLLGLSVPFVARERALAVAAPGGSVYSAESVSRVARLLPMAGLPEGVDVAALATSDGLREGRRVLLDNCVKCHDLKTVLAKPKTPAGWFRTVERMAEKPALFEPISQASQWKVTSYLVAITPDIQKSIKHLREDEEKKEALQEAVIEAGEVVVDETGDAGAEVPPGMVPPAAALAGATIDESQARQSYRDTCSLCHDLSDVDGSPPATAAEVDALIDRMIENDMEAELEELQLIKWYLLKHFVEKSIE